MFSIILNCSCVIPFFFRKSRIQIRLYFTKANLLINYHRVFFPSSPFCGGTWQIHTKNSQEWISALELHIFHYKLVSKTSICLSLQRNHIKFSTFFTGLIFTIPRKKSNANGIYQTHIVCPLILSIPFTHSSEPKEPYKALTRSLSVDCKFVAS